MELRAYAVTDAAACAGLGCAGEVQLVLEHEGVVVGCAGFSEGGEITGLAVREDLRGNGLGKFLLFAVLKQMKVGMVQVETPAGSAGFFEKQGFRAVGSKGELVVMVRKLAVCG